MSTKGRETTHVMKPKRGRSPSVPTKFTPNPPSVLDRIKVFTSSEPTRKTPNPSQTLHHPSSTHNPKKPPSLKPPRRSLDKSLPPSRPPTKSNITRPSTKTTPSTKPDQGVVKPRTRTPTPRRSKSFVNAKENKNVNINTKKQTKPPTNGKKPKQDHNIVTPVQEDDKTILVADDNNTILKLLGDCDNQHLDDHEDGNQIPLCNPSDPIGLEGSSVDEEHTIDLDNEINLQDQVHETCNIASDHLLCPESDQKSDQGLESSDQQVAQESCLVSKDVEQLETEPEPKEAEIEEVPKEEDSASRMVKNQELVVANGKKDTTAYNDVIEETVNKLREQRKNKVKVLVGAFETVILLESDVPNK